MTEFRPSFAAYRARLVVLVPLLILLSVIDYFRFHQPLPVYIAEWLALLVLLAGYIALYFRNTKVTAQPHELTTQNAFGRSRTVSLDPLSSALKLDSFSAGNQSQSRLYLLDPDGKSLLRWSGLIWSSDQMGGLVGALGMHAETITDPITGNQLRKRYPLAVSSIEAHPVWWGIGIAFVVIVAIVVVSLAVVGIPS